MFLRTAERKQAFMKMALQGSAGSGKTYSALLLAKGLVSDWSKIAVIDTEMGSSNLYAHLGPFQVLTLEPPHTPERYIEAIQLCLNGAWRLWSLTASRIAGRTSWTTTAAYRAIPLPTGTRSPHGTGLLWTPSYRPKHTLWPLCDQRQSMPSLTRTANRFPRKWDSRPYSATG